MGVVLLDHRQRPLGAGLDAVAARDAFHRLRELGRLEDRERRAKADAHEATHAQILFQQDRTGLVALQGPGRADRDALAALVAESESVTLFGALDPQARVGDVFGLVERLRAGSLARPDALTFFWIRLEYLHGPLA